MATTKEKASARRRWLELVSSLHTWKRGSERAVNKPLLTLLLLARAYRGEPAEVRYEEIDGPLGRLLLEFGPRRKAYHPENPFWHLQNDGFWVIEESAALRTGRGSPSRGKLLKNGATGHVPSDLWQAVRGDRHLVWELSARILDQFWPGTLHEPICSAVGLPVARPLKGGIKRQRDPAFRVEVLRAYERRCAVCGYDGRLTDVPLGIEAAHVRWHSFSGPDAIENGVALCSFHHLALDSGALGLSDDATILVSADVTGRVRVEELLLSFAGAALRRPQRPYLPPASEHAGWHREQVFKGPARYAFSEPTVMRAAEEEE